MNVRLKFLFFAASVLIAAGCGSDVPGQGNAEMYDFSAHAAQAVWHDGDNVIAVSSSKVSVEQEGEEAEIISVPSDFPGSIVHGVFQVDVPCPVDGKVAFLSKALLKPSTQDDAFKVELFVQSDDDYLRLFSELLTFEDPLKEISVDVSSYACDYRLFILAVERVSGSGGSVIWSDPRLQASVEPASN